MHIQTRLLAIMIPSDAFIDVYNNRKTKKVLNKKTKKNQLKSLSKCLKNGILQSFYNYFIISLSLKHRKSPTSMTEVAYIFLTFTLTFTLT